MQFYLKLGVTTVLTTALLALAATGCGGGSEQSVADDYQVKAVTTVTAAEPPITERQFVSRLNRICRKAWAKVWDNWVVYTDNQDPKLSSTERFEEAVRLSLLAGIDFHIFDNVRILGSPPGEQHKVEAMIEPFQAAVELGQQKHWTADSIDDIPAQFAEYNDRASRYGLEDCLVDLRHLQRLKSLDAADG